MKPQAENYLKENVEFLNPNSYYDIEKYFTKYEVTSIPF